ncbi:hypothetical protein ACFQH6_11900 [Halobacteriaceae archaeon GCM10025711]
MSVQNPVVNMGDYQKLLAIGLVIIASPFVHPLLVLLNGLLRILVPIGFVTMVLGVIVMVSEKT